MVRHRPESISVLWILRAAHTPRVPRHCPRCNATRRFVSSDRFRVNAHKRRLDVWLVYRCPACDFTWNAAIRERVTPEELGDKLPLFHDNDPPTAWRCAFAVAGADREVPVVVERPPFVAPTRITLVYADPIRVRLDRLLADELGRSRTAIARAMREDRIAIAGSSVTIVD